MAEPPMAGVSVVVPSYNRADLIGETLTAILGQTRPPDEVIVVDDGSTDATATVLAGFAGRVRVLPQANSGDMVARNHGLRAASGRLVAFCDSDDVWEPDFLARMSALWLRAPGMVAAYADFRILREGVRSATTKFDAAPADFWASGRDLGDGFHLFEQSLVANLLRFQPLFSSAMMVDRAAFLAVGGWDEGVSRLIGCDLATALRVADMPPMGVLRAPLLAIRKHGGNISGNTEQMNLGDALVLEYVLKTRPELQRLRPAIEASVAERRIHALHSAFARQDFAAVRRIDALLPATAKDLRLRAKVAIAGLPRSIGLPLARLFARDA